MPTVEALSIDKSNDLGTTLAFILYQSFRSKHQNLSAPGSEVTSVTDSVRCINTFEKGPEK
jgi:hypothetical protein